MKGKNRMNKIAFRILAMGTVAALVSIGLLSAAGGAAPALSNSGGGAWTTYREISVAENSGSTLSDYQVLVQLSGSNFPPSAKSDGADIRFTDANGNELSYWMESWDYAGKNTKIWVKIPSISASATATIRIYYGNAGAGSSSNGDGTFDLFDDFNDGVLDSNKWTVTQGGGGDTGYNENAGYLTLWRNTGYGNDRFLRIGSNKQFAANATLEGNLRLTLPNISRLPTFGFGRLSSYNNADEQGCELFGQVGNSQVATFYGTGLGDSNQICTNKYENVTYKNFNAPYDVFEDIRIDWSPYNVNFYYGNYSNFLNTNVPNETMPVYMYIQTENNFGQSRPYNELKVDWVRVRKYASPEPTLTLGAEQPITPPSTTGTISVTTNLAGATFTISGASVYSGSGTFWGPTNASAGTYTITYGGVNGYSSPSSETKTLAAGGSIAFSGSYTLTVPPTTVPPTTVPPTTIPPTTIPPTTVPPTVPSTPAVKPPCGLTASHTTLKDEPEVGEEVLITVTIQNTCDVTAKNIRLTEQLPSSITVSYIDGATSNTPNLVTWNGELAPNRAHAIVHTLRIVEEKNRAIPVMIRYEDEQGNPKETSTTIIVNAQATPKPTPVRTSAPEAADVYKAPGFTGLLVLMGLAAAVIMVRRR
ncbi:Uncharacterised protein [uncultured archaeon]|nr:Uncharacterised protein [uncultured archaeon]